MAMVCAQCSQVFHGKERQCPKCGILLLFQQHNVNSGDTLPRQVDPSSRWQQTPWGRIVVSLIIAQGVAFCMRLLVSAWYQASEGESLVWNSPDGLLMLNAFNAISLVLCGMLAGANQERGITAGGLVGLWNGLIFLGIHRASRDVLEPVVFYAQPLLHLVFGLMGGFIGYHIWRPVPLFAVEGDMGKSGYGMRSNKRLFRGPLHVIRLLLGAGLALAGAVFARQIMLNLTHYSNGMFVIRDYTTERLVFAQVIALAGLAGGTLAGSSTRNGFKHGLFAGVLAAALYFAIQLANPRSILEISLFASLGLAFMTLVGGMFGCTLFPPLVKDAPRKAIPY